MIHLAHYHAANDYPRPWVSISNGSPDWLTVDRRARELFPDWEDVKRAKMAEKARPEEAAEIQRAFIRRYWAKLESLWAKSPEVFETLEGCTALCWEKPDLLFCHRRILAASLAKRGFFVTLDGRPVVDGAFAIGVAARCYWCGQRALQDSGGVILPHPFPKDAKLDGDCDGSGMPVEEQREAGAAYQEMHL